MNRMEEYQAMLGQMEQQPAKLDATLERAYAKKRRNTRKLVVRPLGGLAVCFAAFVLLVNFCTPVAYACAQLPILRELAEAVTFSQSLTDAVEHEYVQPMELSQTENGITAEIAYLIVDQKQVNVFYRLDSKEQEELAADPHILMADGTSPAACSYSSASFGAKNGELRQLNIDFVDGNVPDSLQVKLDVYSSAAAQTQEAPENIFQDLGQDERAYLANFAFTLEFDPQFTATGKVIPVNETVVLDGQSITITDVEVYPTHLRVEIAEDAANTAWLQKLDFYLETDWGMKFQPVSNGIVSTGDPDTPSMVSYRAESPYFYDAKHLKVVVTGASWLRKDRETVHLDLTTGESGALPEGVTFDSARKFGDGWIVKFRADWQESQPMHQLFRSVFFDADGKEYEINQSSASHGEPDEDGKMHCFYEEFPLRDYPYDEVWLSPVYSHTWTAQNPIEVTVQ